MPSVTAYARPLGGNIGSSNQPLLRGTGLFIFVRMNGLRWMAHQGGPG
jgi:hypothetical protein